MSTTEELESKIIALEEENKILKEKLHTYTNPEAKKKYYEANKDKGVESLIQLIEEFMK